MSSTFYELFLHQYSFAKKFQSQDVNRENLCKTLFYEKATHKVLMKLTPKGQFTPAIRHSPRVAKRHLNFVNHFF